VAGRHGSAIAARDLGKDYEGVRAVESLDLDVSSGEFFGFLGPNGAGKTTTVHMLTTLCAPTRGAAWVAGHDVVAAGAALRAKIGVVFQATTLDLDLTAAENLHFAGRLYGLTGDVRERRVREVLTLFDLDDRRSEPVRSFSGGMRRALDLARGILHRPEILFLDEPTLGLDPNHRRKTWAFLARLREEEGTTLFLSTHYLDEADACDRVAILNHGRIIANGTPEGLKRSFATDTIEIEADQLPEDLLGNLQALSRGTLRRTDDGFALSVAAAERALPGLLPLLGGGTVWAVRVRRPTLEDVFVALTSADAGER
jgi:ABC-2 type transport system ATP-binding protein